MPPSSQCRASRPSSHTPPLNRSGFISERKASKRRLKCGLNESVWTVKHGIRSSVQREQVKLERKHVQLCAFIQHLAGHDLDSCMHYLGRHSKKWDGSRQPPKDTFQAPHRRLQKPADQCHHVRDGDLRQCSVIGDPGNPTTQRNKYRGEIAALSVSRAHHVAGGHGLGRDLPDQPAGAAGVLTKHYHGGDVTRKQQCVRVLWRQHDLLQSGHHVASFCNGIREMLCHRISLSVQPACHQEMCLHHNPSGVYFMYVILSPSVCGVW
ncbi:hypothetical protein JOB18_020078 [Solea senegalensis]|uniref:Uncharacterized protein n=1 Tax=Solea senegalensis TaxID=28829 RepID=A0AAV6RDT5_SOLSE|nr:hypothetical protein JOB18_020078 [Solea senegalensis]